MADSPAYYHIPAQLLGSLTKPMQFFGAPAKGWDGFAQGLLRQHPDFTAIAEGTRDGRGEIMLLERPGALQPKAGTYFIGATALQPVIYHPPGPWGPWSARDEARYQDLLRAAQPFLNDDPTAAAAALRRGTVADWMLILNEFDEFRFSVV